MRDLLLSEIVSCFDDDIIEIKGVITDKIIKYIKPIGKEDEYSLDWINPTNENGQSFAEQTKAKAIICNNSIDYSDVLQHEYKVLIVAENPKLLLAKIYQKYFKLLPKPMISNKADISSDAVIGNNCYIGPFCSIGKCRIGDNVTIMPNVTIYDDVEIGDNVIVHSGCSIGSNGLGCMRDYDNTLYVSPHVGGVIISDNVEIGSNSFIARGAFSNTLIKKGTKINGNCFIAHNCIVGENVLFTGSSMIAGSSKIGDNSIVYSNVFVREQITVGANSIIGAGSVVTKEIPANEVWFGSPAKKRRDNEK
jgi:UDP-3-O-[3-hydroxymyristoyl] glucosamine N-acyltransferase